MGKKRATVIGSDEETKIKADRAVKLEQKKLREGLPATKKGKGERVVDTAAESLAEYEKVQEKLNSTEAVTSPSDTQVSTSKKPVHHRSKAYKSAKSQINSDKSYPLSDCLTLLRKVSLTKFDPTVELHLVLKKTPENKLTITLPHSSGQKAKKIAVADDAFIAKLESNTADLNLDMLIASPTSMAKLVKFAKVLGPKGLMPNPKNGTVSPDPEAVAKKMAADQSLTLKLDKSAPVIHTTVGKLSLKDNQLSENITAIITLVGSNLKKAVLKSSMSPAIKIAL